MKPTEDVAIKEASGKSWLITFTVLGWIVLSMTLKGQPILTYVLSFLIGCVPLCVIAYVRPFFSPYANFLTQRNKDSLTIEESKSIMVLKAPSGRYAVWQATGCVAVLLFSLFLARNTYLIEIIPLGRHDTIYGGTASGVVGTIVLTLAYLLYFWSRVLRTHLANNKDKQMYRESFLGK
jgi:hypothetical protein